jgi:hypothetical protein
MVYLVLETRAFNEVIKLPGVIIWAGSNILTELNHQDLVAKGFNVTRFDHSVSCLNKSELEDALETIKEHHPTENIWIQYTSQP